MVGLVSIPSKRGNGSDSWGDDEPEPMYFVSIPSKRGNGSDAVGAHLLGRSTEVSIPSKRGNGSDKQRRAGLNQQPTSQSPQSGAMVRTVQY